MHLKRVLEAVGYQEIIHWNQQFRSWNGQRNCGPGLSCQQTQGGDLDINNLKMAGNLMSWLMLEGIVGTKNLRYKHVGTFIDNTASVSWTQRAATKNSAAAGRLLRVLALRKRVTRASPLAATHVSGDVNVLGNIPSCSFGYSKQWHCSNNSEFLSLIHSKLLLPHQCSWKVFRHSFALGTKIISELGKKVSPIVEWKQLRWIGKRFGGSGVPIENPSELTHTWRKLIFKPKQDLQQDFQAKC